MVVPKCTCPDYVKRQHKTGGKCKHILAVEMAVREKAVS
jgi:predicted nucleic acid-binding Zn finger protein